MQHFSRCTGSRHKPFKPSVTFTSFSLRRWLLLFVTMLISGCSSLPVHETPPQASLDTTLELEAPTTLEIAAPLAWERLVAGFALDIPEHNSRVEAHKQWYRKNQAYLDRVFERAEPFLVFIMDEVEKRGMPMEIALLPVVESAFHPYAFSHGSAAGLWQFIPSTGQLYGLKQNWWYDGRRDVYASTHAALTYLQHLHRQFDGDWAHALAAYNAGPGTLKRAIERNRKLGKPTSYYHLKIPRETKDYVPKLMALAKLVQSPAHYGITLRPISDTLAIRVVELPTQTDLAIAAKMTGLSMESFYALNPSYNRWSTPPTGPHRFIVPIQNLSMFEANLLKIPEQERIIWSLYNVKPGDTLSTIAKDHNVSVEKLKQTNSLQTSKALNPHQTLKIPRSEQPSHYYTHSDEQRENRPKPGKVRVEHRVVSGDSLWSVARRYGVDTRSIAEWNKMSTKGTLATGKTLTLWVSQNHRLAKASTPTDRYTKKIHYKVRKGESLSHIASKFKLAIRDITSWNPNTTKKRYLQPGDLLTLFVDIRH